MKTRKQLRNVLAVVVAALASLLASAHAQIVYVDMSQAGGNYQVGANWVNVRNGNGTAENLVDIANVATTFDVTLTGYQLPPVPGCRRIMVSPVLLLWHGFHADGQV